MQYNTKFIFCCDAPSTNQRGICHAIHTHPVISVAIGNGNFFSNSGCIMPRHPISSLPPPRKVADNITIGVANQGISGFVSIEETPITNAWIAQNNSKYPKLFLLQENTYFSIALGDLSDSTKIAAIVGPKPPIRWITVNTPCEEFTIFKCVNNANPHQQMYVMAKVIIRYVISFFLLIAFLLSAESANAIFHLNGSS